MRPIDADKLSKQIEELYLDGDSASNHLCINNEDTLIGKFQVLDLICDQPTVEDVAPVVHARWISKMHKMWGRCPTCSHCGRIVQEETNYCPRCGAKMGGE